MSSITGTNSVLTRVYKGVGTVVVGSGFAKASLLGVEFYLAVSLGAAGYGFYSIAFAFLLLVPHLAQMGFSYGIIQYLSRYTEQGDKIAVTSVARVGLIFSFLMSTAIGVAVFIGAHWLANRLFHKPELASLLRAASFIIPFECLNLCMSSIFRGLRQYRNHVVVSDLIRNLIMLTALPLALIGKLDTITVFYIVGFGTVAGSLTGLALLAKQLDLFHGFRRDLFVLRQLFSFSYLLFLWQILQLSASQLIVLLAGSILSATDVGVLAVVMRFLNILNFLQTAFNTTTPVEFARYYFLKDNESINHMFQVVTLTIMIVSLALSLPLFSNAPTIMSLIGSDYASYGWVLIGLLTGKLIDVGTGPTGQLLIACRQRKTILGLAGFDSALQFLFVVPLMMKFGMAGAVYGNASRTVMVIAARHIMIYRLLKVYSITRPLLSLFSCGITMSFVGFTLSNAVRGLAIKSCLTLITFVAMLIGLYCIMRNEPRMGAPIIQSFIGRIQGHLGSIYKQRQTIHLKKRVK